MPTHAVHPKTTAVNPTADILKAHAMHLKAAAMHPTAEIVRAHAVHLETTSVNTESSSSPSCKRIPLHKLQPAYTQVAVLLPSGHSVTGKGNLFCANEYG